MLINIFYYFILAIIAVPNLILLYITGSTFSMVVSLLLLLQVFALKKDMGVRLERISYVILTLSAMIFNAIAWFLYFFPIIVTPEGGKVIPVPQIFFGVAVGAFVTLLIYVIFKQIRKNNVFERYIVLGIGAAGLLMSFFKIIKSYL